MIESVAPVHPEIGAERARRLELLTQAAAERPELVNGPREDAFLADLQLRVARFGDRLRLSERQRAWLNDIWARFREAGAVEDA